MARRPERQCTSSAQDVKLPAGRAFKEETLLRKGLDVYLTLPQGWETMTTSLEVLSRHAVSEAMKQSFRDSFKLDIRQGHNPQTTHILVRNTAT